MTDNEELKQTVLHYCESIEELDDPYDSFLDPLEWYVESNPDRSLREIYLVLETGGPQIELALFAKRVDGYWSGQHSAPIIPDDARDLVDEVAERYEAQWEDGC